MKAKLILILMSLNLFAWNTEFTVQEKPVLYMLSATYCEYCKKDMRTFEEEPLKSYSEKNFYKIYQHKDLINVPSHLDADITPTYYILKSNGEIVSQIRGTQSKENLIKFLNQGMYKAKQ
jgi:thioredoxin-related protein